MNLRWSRIVSRIRPYIWLVFPVGILLVSVVVAIVIIRHDRAVDVESASNVIVDCSGARSSDFACWQSRYQAMVARKSPEAAFVDFKENYKTNPYITSNCHQIGHVIGRAAALKYATLSETYKHGDDFCWSGYYHGATETVAKKIGKDKLLSKITTVCQDFYKAGKYSFDHYNCVHGMGHGVMAVENGELFTALKLCDGYTDNWERQSCYGGVFMENVMNEINPGKRSSYLKQDDPLYPCTASKIDTRNNVISCRPRTH